MNLLEQIVHSQIGHYPRLRIPLVAAYQRLLSIVPSRNYMAELPTRRRAGAFFGFHDKCPWSADGKWMLAHVFDADKSLEHTESGPIQIGILKSESMEFHPLGTTSTWNWQQGAMLQWVGRQNLIVFNDYLEGRNTARLITPDGEEAGRLPLHVASVSSDGRRALSYSFERMRYAAPEYAYRVGEHPDERAALPKHEALRVIDVGSGEFSLALSLEDVSAHNPEHSMDGAYHYFTHGLFSPDGTKFAFLHRWVGKRNVLHTRLYSCDLDGSHLYQFPATHTSHFCWRDSDWIFAYCKPRDRAIGYYLLHDRHAELEFAGESFPAGDGHPQITSGGRFVVTDTYPDRRRVQSLMIHDLDARITRVLAAVRIGFDYRYERRCDFHPRWNRDGTQVCFDSAHSGVRSMFVMDLPRPAPSSGAAELMACGRPLQ